MSAVITVVHNTLRDLVNRLDWCWVLRWKYYACVVVRRCCRSLSAAVRHCVSRRLPVPPRQVP